MLHVLDPHSNFYDPKAYAQMREDQHGKYYGVGMTIQPQPRPDVPRVRYEDRTYVAPLRERTFYCQSRYRASRAT